MITNHLLHQLQITIALDLASFCQCWALPQTGPQVRKLRTQGFGLRICGPVSYRKHLRICGKKIEIYRKSANQQHH